MHRRSVHRARLSPPAGASGERRNRADGWLPRTCSRAGRSARLTASERGVEGATRTLIGALPMYLKSNSYGEFIFDFGWANAAMRAGLPYYPKLVSAVPFTPAGGRRLLVREDDREALTPALVGAAQTVAQHEGASSLHVLFCTGDESERLGGLGMHARKSTQYHFENHEGLDSFDAFLASLRSPSRKQVRKERERRRATGSRSPCARSRSSPKTTSRRCGPSIAAPSPRTAGALPARAFFELLHANPHAYASMAHADGRPVAGALFFFKGRSLYGATGARGPSCRSALRLCYYLPLEWGSPGGSLASRRARASTRSGAVSPEQVTARTGLRTPGSIARSPTSCGRNKHVADERPPGGGDALPTGLIRLSGRSRRRAHTSWKREIPRVSSCWRRLWARLHPSGQRRADQDERVGWFAALEICRSKVELDGNSLFMQIRAMISLSTTSSSTRLARAQARRQARQGGRSRPHCSGSRAQRGRACDKETLTGGGEGRAVADNVITCRWPASADAPHRRGEREFIATRTGAAIARA